MVLKNQSYDDDDDDDDDDDGLVGVLIASLSLWATRTTPTRTTCVLFEDDDGADGFELFDDGFGILLLHILLQHRRRALDELFRFFKT